MVYTVQAITTKSTTKATTKSPITYNDPIIKLITIYHTKYKMKALEVGYLDIRYWILDKKCFFYGNETYSGSARTGGHKVYALYFILLHKIVKVI